MLESLPFVFASVGGCGLVALMVLVWRELRAQPVYVPRHRAIDAPSTMQQIAQRRLTATVRQADELLAGLSDVAHDAPELDRPARGVRAYRQLQTRALDASTAGHSGLRSPWGTPAEVDDEWDPIPEGVAAGYVIAGATR